MPEISVFLCILAGAATGGFVNGLAGFGTGLMSLGIWLQAMPTQSAVPIVAAMSVLSGVQSLWVTRRTLTGSSGRLLRFLLPALAGMPLGLVLLNWVEASVLKIPIAMLMLTYACFVLLRAKLPRFEKPHPVADGCVGLASGILGGAASLSGVICTMWCALQPWTKFETSAVLRPFNVTVLTIAMVSYAVQGMSTLEVLTATAVAVPATLVASQLGLAVFRRISDTAFRRTLVGIMLTGGILLIARECLPPGSL